VQFFIALEIIADISYVGEDLQEEMHRNSKCFKLTFKITEELTKSLWFMLDSIDITEQIVGKHWECYASNKSLVEAILFAT